MFLGLDIGTSEVKALLLNDAHKMIGTAGAALDVSRPQPGYSEQHPMDWWLATQAALSQLRASHRQAYDQVRAIGLSGQMHGAVLLDGQGQVLRPAMLWNDTRASAECTEMMDEMPSLAHVAGSLAMPGFTAPKLRWLAKHEPELFSRIDKVMCPKDFVSLQLTGDCATDMSDASGTMWLDIAKRDWSDAALALTGLSRQHMPRLLEGSQSRGYVSAVAVNLLRLPASVLVAAGAGDNAASAVGMGAVQPGQGFLSLGTSGVLFVVTPSYQPNAASATHAFCHALPNRWHQMSVMLSAASCLQWAARLLGAESVGELEAQAASLNANQRAHAPIFLPYLSGERTPHNSASVRGSFHGLSHDTGSAELAYAVMEGVSFGLCDGLAALKSAGSQVERLSLVGGGARSAFWAQQLASSMGISIVTHGGAEAGGALGAARLGWLALGGSEQDVCIAPSITDVFTPSASEQALLAPRYQRFKALYHS